MLKNSPTPLSTGEIADHLATEGDLFRQDDVVVQFKRVQGKLNKLRAKRIVKSHRLKGHALTWSMASLSENLRAVTESTPARLLLIKPLSDVEWADIRRNIPTSAQQISAEEPTRRFIEAVLSDVLVDGKSRLKPRERKRFLVWHHLGVWSKLVGVIDRDLTEGAFNGLANDLLSGERP